MFGTLARFRKIAVRSFDQRMLVAVGELACHRVVSGFLAFIRLQRALVAVGIILKMITGAIRHAKPLAQFARYLRTDIHNDIHEATRKPHGGANTGVEDVSDVSVEDVSDVFDDASDGAKASQVVVIATIGKFYRRLTYV